MGRLHAILLHLECKLCWLPSLQIEYAYISNTVRQILKAVRVCTRLGQLIPLWQLSKCCPWRFGHCMRLQTWLGLKEILLRRKHTLVAALPITTRVTMTARLLTAVEPLNLILLKRLHTRLAVLPSSAWATMTARLPITTGRSSWIPPGRMNTSCEGKPSMRCLMLREQSPILTWR